MHKCGMTKDAKSKALIVKSPFGKSFGASVYTQMLPICTCPHKCFVLFVVVIVSHIIIVIVIVIATAIIFFIPLFQSILLFFSQFGVIKGTE